jgi:hypothetical protein
MAGPWEEYASTGPAAAAPWEEYAGGGSVRQQIDNDAISKGARSFAADGWGGKYLTALGGAVRGAGSIGATLLRPFEGKQANEQRRADMDATNRSFGADTDSLLYKVPKIATEVAGTMGVGGVLGRGVQALGSTRFATGLEPIVEGVTRGLQTGGFRVGELAGTGLGTAARAATGAAVGGAGAAMVDPSTAASGAIIGGALPGAVQVAGAAGRALRGTPGNINPTRLATAERAMDAGYVIPPSQVNPSYANRFLESQSGKFETAQLASTGNQEVSERLVRQSLGMTPDAPLSLEAMRHYRAAQHATGYNPIRQLGPIPAGQDFDQALNTVVRQYTGHGTIPAIQRDDILDLVQAHRSQGFHASDAVDAVRVLRENASDAFAAGNGALGRANRAIADAYENAIDGALQRTGQRDLLQNYRAARRNIAMSGTVEKAIREGSGTIDARIIGRELQKGKPLTGELRTVGEFGNVFDKAAQPPHLLGSPAVNALKPANAALQAGLGAFLGGPMGAAIGAALPYAVPPAARSIMFSPRFQRGLLNVGNAAVDEPLGLLTQGAYRAAPLLPAQ